jgi:hypothetical protein
LRCLSNAFMSRTVVILFKLAVINIVLILLLSSIAYQLTTITAWMTWLVKEDCFRKSTSFT